MVAAAVEQVVLLVVVVGVAAAAAQKVFQRAESNFVFVKPLCYLKSNTVLAKN